MPSTTTPFPTTFSLNKAQPVSGLVESFETVVLKRAAVYEAASRIRFIRHRRVSLFCGLNF